MVTEATVAEVGGVVEEEVASTEETEITVTWATEVGVAIEEDITAAEAGVTGETEVVGISIVMKFVAAAVAFRTNATRRTAVMSERVRIDATHSNSSSGLTAGRTKSLEPAAAAEILQLPRRKRERGSDLNLSDFNIVTNYHLGDALK